MLLPRDVMIAVYHILPALMGVLFIADFTIPKLDVAKLLHIGAHK